MHTRYTQVFITDKKTKNNQQASKATYSIHRCVIKLFLVRLYLCFINCNNFSPEFGVRRLGEVGPHLLYVRRGQAGVGLHSCVFTSLPFLSHVLPPVPQISLSLNFPSPSLFSSISFHFTP